MKGQIDNVTGENGLGSKLDASNAQFALVGNTGNGSVDMSGDTTPVLSVVSSNINVLTTKVEGSAITIDPQVAKSDTAANFTSDANKLATSAGVQKYVSDYVSNNISNIKYKVNSTGNGTQTNLLDFVAENANTPDSIGLSITDSGSGKVTFGLNAETKAKLDTIDKNKGVANKDLDNLTDKGTTVIQNIARDAIQINDGKNTTVNYSIEADYNRYTVDVNSELKDITSISNGDGTDDDATTLSITNNGLGLNDKKITGLADGSETNDAVNFGQLDKVQKDVDKVKDALGLNGVDGTNGQTSTGPAGKDGLDGKSILDKVQAGRDGLSGNMVYTDKDGNRLDKVGDKYYKADDVKAAIDGEGLKLAKDGKYYPTANVDQDGNPTQGATGKDLAEVLTTANKEPVPTKDMQISAINPDGTATSPTTIGNVASGLGLDNVKGATPTAITEAKAKEAVAGTNGQSGLLTKSGNDLNKVATVGDLQALAQAGIDFTDGQQTAVTVHRPLGTALKIQGNANTNYDNTKYSAENLVTQADTTNNTITISMLKTPKFDALELGKVKLTPSEDGSKLTLSNTTTNPAPTDNKVVLTGIKDGTTEDSAVSKKSLDEVKNSISSVAQEAVKLEDGKNTTVNSTLDHNLNVTYTVDVNSNLEDIDSITNSDGSTTLDITDKGLTLNNKKIDGLAEATLSSTSTEAVSGKQLVAKAKEIASALGGDAAVSDTDGTFTQPTYKLKTQVGGDIGTTVGSTNDGGTGGTYKTVGDALTAIDSGLAKLKDDGLKFAGDTATTTETAKLTKKVQITGGTDAANRLITSSVTADTDNGVIVTLGIDTTKLAGKVNLGYKLNGSNPQTTTLANGLDFIAGDGTEKENTDNSKIADSATAKEGIKIVAGKDGKIIIGLDEATKKAIDTVAGTTNGIDGTTGPSGKDGQNGKTLAQKVQAGRDGLTGSMVYTDKDGNRLEKAGDKYYKADEIAAAGLKQANDGKYYNSSDVEADGTPKANASSVDVDQKMTDAGKKAVEPKDMQVSAVNPDGSTTTPTAIGNVASGLGLDNVNKKTPTAITEAKAKEAVAGTNGLLTKSGKDLNNVATVGDLQALAQAGIDFTDGQQTSVTVHRPLGTALKIQGNDNTNYDNTKYSAENLVTKADSTNNTITISMLKTPKFDAVELGNVKLTPNADGSKLTLSNTTTNPAPADTKVVLDGVKEGITADSVATKGSVDDIKKALGLNGTNGTNGTGTQGSTGPAGKDGLDGKTIMEQIQAGRDGLSGNMVYTNTDGDRLEKVGEKYYKAEDVQNAIKDSTLKQAKDGKFYPANDVNEKGEHTGTGQGKTLSEVLTEQNKTEVETKDIKISAINPDGTAKTPTIIGNVADGVKDNDAVNVKQLDALKSSLTDTGLTFTNGTIEKTTKLGKKVTIKGGTGNSEYITSTITQDGDGNTSYELGINTTNLTTALGTGTIGSGDTNNGGKATDKNLVTGTTVNTAINNAKEELQNAIDKVQGQIGPQGATGIDGSNGTSGTDGQNGKTLGQKVQAGRDGLTGSMVYTDDNGNRLEKVGDDYFKASDIKDADLKQANDGKYYKANEVDASGNPLQNATAITDVKAELKKADKEPVATKDIRITAVNPDGSTTAPTKIGNVADGVNANDAVNKGQLDALKSSIEDGTIVGKMSYKVNDNPANATKADFLNFVAGDGEKTTSEDAQKGIVIVDGGAGKVIIGLDKETREKINAIDQNIVEKGVADKDLSNISTNGETVVKNLAKEAVKVVAGANVTVTPKEADGNITYTVAVNKDLKGITSITNGDDTTEGTKITLSNDGVSLNDKKITGLANGDVTKDSTDAINGSQLYNSNKEISLALGAGFNQATGQIEEPEYELKSKKDGEVGKGAGSKDGKDGATYNNVKDALAAIDSVASKNREIIKDTADATDASKFADDDNKGKLATAGGVTNYVDTRFEAFGNDVNKVVNNLQSNIERVDSQASAGTASAMAAATIPQVQNTTNRNAVGIGFGNYRGQSAIAVGISGMNHSRDILYKASLTFDSSNSVGASAGIGFTFGSKTPKSDNIYRENDYNERLNKQQEEIVKLNSEKEEQNNKIKSLEEQNNELRKQIQELAALIHAKVG